MDPEVRDALLIGFIAGAIVGPLICGVLFCVMCRLVECFEGDYPDRDEGGTL